MKNLELKVMKINEDVISTSSVSGEFCTNHTTHYIFTEITWQGTGNDKADYIKYYYENGWKKESYTNQPVRNASDTANIELDLYNKNMYYKYNDAGTGLRFCNDTDGHFPSVVQ